MWISSEVQARLEKKDEQIRELIGIIGHAEGESTRLREENARLVAMNGWFQHRLNQVEMERAMLMQDRIGVKINVPQFVPAMENPDEALNRVVDLTTVGGDAADDSDPATTGFDYTNLPRLNNHKDR